MKLFIFSRYYSIDTYCLSPADLLFESEHRISVFEKTVGIFPGKNILSMAVRYSKAAATDRIQPAVPAFFCATPITFGSN